MNAASSTCVPPSAGVRVQRTVARVPPLRSAVPMFEMAGSAVTIRVVRGVPGPSGPPSLPFPPAPPAVQGPPLDEPIGKQPVVVEIAKKGEHRLRRRCDRSAGGDLFG